VIETLSYNEAMELAYFGAKVIHPQTMGAGGAGTHPDLDQEHVRAGQAGHADPRPFRARSTGEASPPSRRSRW